MSAIKGQKCPSCGAPLELTQNQATVKCHYCGQSFKIEQTTVSHGNETTTEVRLVKQRRNALDYTLMVLGIIWILLVLAALIQLNKLTDITYYIAALLLASPGIVLLMIAFRRKKPKLETIHHKKE